ETDVPFTLIPGVLTPNSTDVQPGTSGAVIHGDTLTIPLTQSGSETLTVGAQRNGFMPVVVKASSVMFPKIPIQNLACACVRGIAAKTCGGIAFDPGGSAATDCTPDFTAGDSVCTSAGLNPCAFVHGPGNSAAGIVGCNGLDGVNASASQDDSDGSCDS